DLNYIARLCALQGMINGVPYSLASRYMPPGKVAFQSINSKHELFRAVIFDSKKDQSQFKDVEELGWRFDHYAIVWRPDLLVMEKSLVAKNAPDPASVVGAYRIESRDGGQSWENPHLTLKPEVF